MFQINLNKEKNWYNNSVSFWKKFAEQLKCEQREIVKVEK